MAYSYRCKDYPGMEACPASFTTRDGVRTLEAH